MIQDADLIDALASLPNPQSYTPKDRYNDFRRVFMGTEEGKRALREILSWGGMFRPSVIGNPIDPYRMAVREGERNMALKLLAAVYQEPPEKPVKTSLSKREK